MKLYCVSIFLKHTVFAQLYEMLRSAGFSSSFRRESLVDQIGDQAETIQGQVGHLSIIFIPCNDFHQHADFEIGLTETSIELWNKKIEELQRLGVISETGTMPDSPSTSYGTIGDSTIHGPFFAIFDGYSSNLSHGDYISFDLPEIEHQFYSSIVASVLDESLTHKFRIEKAVVKHPTMKEISIRTSESNFEKSERPDRFYCTIQDEGIWIGTKEFFA